jgi:hypothetical protein
MIQRRRMSPGDRTTITTFPACGEQPSFKRRLPPHKKLGYKNLKEKCCHSGMPVHENHLFLVNRKAVFFTRILCKLGFHVYIVKDCMHIAVHVLELSSLIFITKALFN